MENLSNIVLFADDLSLIFKVDRKDENTDKVNDTLAQINNCFTSNNLVLNCQKTKCIALLSV